MSAYRTLITSLITPLLFALIGSLYPLREISAHELRPSLLKLEPRAKGHIYVTFRIGFARGAPMNLSAQLPSHCRRVIDPVAVDEPPVRTVNWVEDCGAQGLVGHVSVEGLAETGTDVIVRAPSQTLVLRSTAPSQVLTRHFDDVTHLNTSTLSAYINIGVIHIWFGADHLLFVLGLVLLVGRRWRLLLGTVTSFTLAHSVTLALSILGYINVPTRAVEAIIALSIVALATELARGDRSTWAARAPWVFAWVCGLLHGFGFAGALGEVGLPSDAVPAALLGFNIGVELGQLGFIAGLLIMGELMTRRQWERGHWMIIYGMGGVGSFWFWTRVAHIWVNAHT